MSPARSGLGRLAAHRGAAQLLPRPSAIRHPVDVVREAGPVQAQEPRAARLAFRARGGGLLAADVDRARTEERSLLRAWLMRKTVHLIAAEDAGWMLDVFAERLVGWSRRRMADLGLDAGGQERALAIVRREVDARGAVSRPEVVERLVEAGFETAPEIKYHLWFVATLEGGLCLGPDRGGQTCLVRTADWIGEPRARPREDALAELARRYLRAFAPADDRDLARWSGLPLGECRLGIARIAGELREVRVAGRTLLAPARGRRRHPGSAVVRLLGAYDSYNLGYVSREFALAPGQEARVVPGGGVVRPTITVDGRVVGVWSSRRSGRRLAVTVEPFEAPGPAIERAIAAEVADLGRFEGLAATLAGRAPLRSRAEPGGTMPTEEGPAT